MCLVWTMRTQGCTMLGRPKECRQEAIKLDFLTWKWRIKNAKKNLNVPHTEKKDLRDGVWGSRRSLSCSTALLTFPQCYLPFNHWSRLSFISYHLLCCCNITFAVHHRKLSLSMQSSCRAQCVEFSTETWCTRQVQSPFRYPIVSVLFNTHK